MSMEKLEPLLLKNSEHLTAEERSKVEAFERRLNRQRERITERCNFMEIKRHESLFDKSTYESLLRKSLAKTDSQDLPKEF